MQKRADGGHIALPVGTVSQASIREGEREEPGSRPLAAPSILLFAHLPSNNCGVQSSYKRYSKHTASPSKENGGAYPLLFLRRFIMFKDNHHHHCHTCGHGRLKSSPQDIPDTIKLVWIRTTIYARQQCCQPSNYFLTVYKEEEVLQSCSF